MLLSIDTSGYILLQPRKCLMRMSGGGARGSREKGLRWDRDEEGGRDRTWADPSSLLALGPSALPWAAFPLPGHRPFPHVLPHGLEFSNPNCIKTKRERRKKKKKPEIKEHEGIREINTNSRKPVTLTTD